MKKKETIWKVVLEYQHVLQPFTQYYSSEVFFFQYLQDILSVATSKVQSQWNLEIPSATQ